MPKVCIFCGGAPKGKTKEHILPSWLLELTGDPDRLVHLSTHYDADERTVSHRQFAFSNYVFPACAECNAAYSGLEAAAKGVVLKLLDAVAINGADIHVLLEWLDKVRVGLWLGELMLGGNPLEIKPNFHISSRVGTTDRAVFISRLAPGDGLSAIGTRTPLFTYMPSVFGMRINNLIFLNASTDSLFSKQIGFPYPKTRKRIKGTVAMQLDMVKGRGRIKTPLIPRQYDFPALKFFQPMFTAYLFNPKLRPYFDDPYVKKNCWAWDKGVGKVFHMKGNQLLPFEANVFVDYASCEIWDRPNIRDDFSITVLDWQMFMMRFMPSHRNLEKARSRAVSRQQQFAKRFNKRLIEGIRAENS